MKFQDSSFNGLNVTVGTKSVTHAHAPSTFSKLGINTAPFHCYPPHTLSGLGAWDTDLCIICMCNLIAGLIMS